MITKTATIRNSAGIHCRPSAIIIKAAAEYAGDITVTGNDEKTGLRSVLELISMGLEEGEQITITVDGPEEERFAEKLVEIFETEYDFPPM